MSAPGRAIAEALGRLVSLIRYDAPASAQSSAQERLRVLTRMDGVRLTVVDDALRADDARLSSAAVADLVDQMAAHAVESLEIHSAADPIELVAVARALASDADSDVPGAAFRVHFPPHDGRTVRVRVPDVDRPDGRFHAVHGEVLDAAVQVESGGDSYLSFGAVERPTESLEAMLERLDQAPNLAMFLRVLDMLTAFGEHASRGGRPEDLSALLAAVMLRAEWEGADDRRRALAGLLRRFRNPPMLAQIATCIIRGAVDRRNAVTVLGASEDLGADAIIDALVNATERTHRQAYLQALREVPVASGSLTHMMGDSRWFVTRNAAYLIGELRLTALDGTLFAHRAHADERVRIAVLTALAKLGTSKSIAALQAAIRDPSPSVRRFGASAVGALPPERAVAMCRQALARETDDDVRAALFGALGHADNDEAVNLLADAAAPGGRVFGRKPPKPRIAAVQALQRMTAPRAQDVLASLRQDVDADVRAAANAPPAVHRRTGIMTPLSVPVADPPAGS